jgi:hypothetical protein
MVTAASEWYTVRCLFGQKTNKPWLRRHLAAGEFAHEERLTLWQTDSAETAIALAEQEARLYETQIEVEYLGLAQSYRLADGLGPGAEVFSLIRKSTLDPRSYLDTFFDTGDEYQRPL